MKYRVKEREHHQPEGKLCDRQRKRLVVDAEQISQRAERQVAGGETEYEDQKKTEKEALIVPNR